MRRTQSDAGKVMAALDELWQVGDGMIFGKLHVRDDLIDLLEAARADAWDEGFDASEIWSSSAPCTPKPDNPYRRLEKP